MKKIFLVSLCLLLLLTGCGDENVNTKKQKLTSIGEYSFGYDDTTKDYALRFQLLDQDGNGMAMDASVKVRIVNAENKELYNETWEIKETDFIEAVKEAPEKETERDSEENETPSVIEEEESKNESETASDETANPSGETETEGEKILYAEIHIKREEIKKTGSESGTVYLTIGNVAKGFEVRKCLPTEEAKLEVDQLPMEISVLSFGTGADSKIRVDEVYYEYVDDGGPTLKVYVVATKTYERRHLSFDAVNYKLFDKENHVVRSGQVNFELMALGNQQESSTRIYDITPGETYRIAFYDYAW